MSDTGLKNADIDPATAETGSIGSRGGSRKGSVVGDCTVDRKISPDDVSRGGSIRRRSTLVAPPFGSNGAMKPSEGEGAVQRVVTARRDSNMPNDEGNGTKSEAQEAAGYHEIIAWMKDHLVLPGFVLKNHWTDDHDEVGHDVPIYRLWLSCRDCLIMHRLSSVELSYLRCVVLLGTT